MVENYGLIPLYTLCFSFICQVASVSKQRNFYYKFVTMQRLVWSSWVPGLSCNSCGFSTPVWSKEHKWAALWILAPAPSRTPVLLFRIQS